MDLKWGPNWEDDLAGAHVTGLRDPNVVKMQEQVKFEFEKTFMLIYLGCVNTASILPVWLLVLLVLSINEKTMYCTRNQEACRSWRMCMTGCPYKKIYFNWQTHKAEKCIFCFPRIEAGQPTVCSETCSGRVRYIGVILYDADKVKAAASHQEQDLYQAQLDVFLDPNDPEVVAQARRDGISEIGSNMPNDRRFMIWSCVMVWRCPFIPISYHAMVGISRPQSHR